MKLATLILAAAALTLSACDRPAEPAPEPMTEAAEASGVAPAVTTPPAEAPAR